MDNKSFFNLVKGKKIKWSNWEDGKYFIPVKIHKDINGNAEVMSGLYYVLGNLETKRFRFVNGFAPGGSGNFWELLEPIKYIIME